MISVIFVCLGNICRSPMAEFVFKKMVDERGLSLSFDITSRGRPTRRRATAYILPRRASSAHTA